MIRFENIMNLRKALVLLIHLLSIWRLMTVSPWGFGQDNSLINLITWFSCLYFHGSNQIVKTVWALHSVLSERSIASDSNFPGWYFNHSDRCMRFLQIVYKVVSFCTVKTFCSLRFTMTHTRPLTHPLQQQWGNDTWSGTRLKFTIQMKQEPTNSMKDIPSYWTS